MRARIAARASFSGSQQIYYEALRYDLSSFLAPNARPSSPSLPRAPILIKALVTTGAFVRAPGAKPWVELVEHLGSAFGCMDRRALEVRPRRAEHLRASAKMEVRTGLGSGVRLQGFTSVRHSLVTCISVSKASSSPPSPAAKWQGP
eukprot:scaffold190865_cov28-Tisochrysis_lutea.AAC.1